MNHKQNHLDYKGSLPLDYHFLHYFLEYQVESLVLRVLSYEVEDLIQSRSVVGNSFWLAGHIGGKIGQCGPVLVSYGHI